MRIRFAAVLIGVLFQAASVSAQSKPEKDVPEWVSTLKEELSEHLRTNVEIRSARVVDHVDGEEHPVVRLKGQGSLSEVSDPFGATDGVFLRDGWERDDRYLADGHGSAQRAFRQLPHLCIARVTIDSSDEDEETGHVPSVFWFEIDCRNSGG